MTHRPIRRTTHRNPLTASSLERLLDLLEPRRLFAVGGFDAAEADAGNIDFSTVSTASALIADTSATEMTDCDEVGGKVPCPCCGGNFHGSLTAASIDSEQSAVAAKSTIHRADKIWTGLDAQPRTTADTKLGFSANAFEAFSLDTSRLATKLATATPENLSIGIGQSDRLLEISVPTPEGTLARFNIVESSIMAPELQAAFPDIRTYAGYGVDDPSAYIRLDFTPRGFHAQVLSPGATFYVDPYFDASRTTYASYYRRDAFSTSDFVCQLDHDHAHDLARAGTPEISDLNDNPNVVETTSGSQLRTYRTAVAATAEFTALAGGTVSAGQAAIVTAINRVTGIYETELSIRLQLVANNQNLVFTDTNTDGYTNSSLSAMLTQNQTKIDTVIGSANYDVGHIFSTSPDGGLAGLGVVGVNGSKARGGTGTNSLDDIFYVDYVAHEIGHQFGGNHNFNTSSVGGNRNASTAYERGSGSTIMAYAGITGSNSDLQTNSDPYFGWISAQEIINRSDNVIPGVGTRTATGNSVPTVNGGADFTIPAQTPFALTAVGSDGNGDTLTYSWEQANLGAAQLLNAGDNGASPLFRAYSPTTSPTRTFPRLQSVLAGSSTTAAPFGGSAELLPTTNRNLSFRVTARDNRAGGGGLNTDDVSLTVVNTGAAFSVTSFNTATTFTGGTLQTVTWNVAGTTGSGINTANVMISLSTNGGNTFTQVLAASTPNDGSESVTIPNVASTQVRIKVEAVGNIFFDINNANLTINAATTPAPGTPDLDAVSDTGISSTDNITRLNNSNASNVLSFTVPNTIAGATVEILANGVAVGSAVATGTTTTVVTNGTSLINNGSRNFTSRQTQPSLPASAQSSALPVLIDFTAPIGGEITFDRLVGPHQVKVVFSEDVAGSLTGSDLALTNTAPGGSNGTPAVSYNAGTNTATFTFPIPAGGLLADGNYSAFISRFNVTDVAGNNPATSMNGLFRFLRGDANGDGDVDLDDFTTLAANFGQSPRNFAQADFNYSNNVDLDDFTALASNFGVTLPPLEASLPRLAGAFSQVTIGTRTIDLADDLLRDTKSDEIV
mgnify:CR=1 FL=1